MTRKHCRVAMAELKGHIYHDSGRSAYQSASGFGCSLCSVLANLGAYLGRTLPLLSKELQRYAVSNGLVATIIWMKMVATIETSSQFTSICFVSHDRIEVKHCVEG